MRRGGQWLSIDADSNSASGFGLYALHFSGRVRRDVKSGNIMPGRDSDSSQARGGILDFEYFMDVVTSVTSHDIKMASNTAGARSICLTGIYSTTGNDCVHGC